MNHHAFVRSALVTSAALIAAGLTTPAFAQPAQKTVGQAVYHDTSARIDHGHPDNRGQGAEHRQIPIKKRENQGRFPDLTAPDGGVQSESADATQLGPTPAPDISFPGLGDDDNAAVTGGRIVPPDTNGDIGRDDNGNPIYIQYINSIWAVYDADTGNLDAGPYAGNSFWQGFGGFCQTNNDGDPVVLYDDHAGRWVFSQFSISQGIQCVAVSATSDPLGSYHRYAFTVTPGGNNDYPKLGVWDDSTSGSSGQSAYTFTTRDFGGAGGSFSVGAGVMDRDAMLTGAKASFVKFINPCNSTDCIEGQLPPHLAGPTPPAGTCPTFWSAVDAAYDDSPFADDGYRNHTLCVDWGNPGNSTYSEGSFVPSGSNFDRFLGGGFSKCISPVPKRGEALDCLAAFTMYRAQYRWFGTHGSVVLNTTVDAGGDRAGIRWAETRSADGDSGWSLQQDGTYAPADGLDRWMGSIAQDGDGNIALGYSVVGRKLFPAVRYVTRTEGDAAGTMPGGEVSCVEGTGVQRASYNRWGDYSSMSVDPIDDCTFWFTTEYYETTGSFDFETRICSFRLPDCGAAVGCSVDADCDNGLFCDGAETCNAGSCQAGTAPVCDDELFCNGTGTCNEDTNACDPGTSPDDDGVSCTVDSCDEATDSIVNVPNDSLCADDSQFCNGNETCDPINDCQSGGDPCTGGEICNEDLNSCQEPSDPTSVHVHSIVTGTEKGSRGNKHGKASVTIHDSNHDPVGEGYTVTGDFSGTLTQENASGLTEGSAGIAVIVTSESTKPVNVVNFCVRDVSSEGLLDYNLADSAPGTTCSP